MKSATRSPRPRHFQRLVLGIGMSVALFIIDRQVLKAFRRRERPVRRPVERRGINVSGSDLREDG